MCAQGPKLLQQLVHITSKLRTTIRQVVEYLAGLVVAGENTSCIVDTTLRMYCSATVMLFCRTSYGSSLRYRSDTTYNLVIECCEGYHDPAGGIECQRMLSLNLHQTSICLLYPFL